jgi:hypothetical protein
MTTAELVDQSISFGGVKPLPEGCAQPHMLQTFELTALVDLTI